MGYGFGLRREAKRIGAGQKIEVRKRKFGTEKILLGVRKLALRNCQPTTFSSDGIPSSGKSHARSIADTLRLQGRLGEALLQIPDDGACLVSREIAMLQDWHAG